LAALELRISSARLARDAFEVTVAGEVDLHGAPALEAAFDEVVAAGAVRVLLDLTAVPFLDSLALGVLMKAHKRLELLVLAIGDVRVLRVFEITGLDRALNMERSRTEALARLSQAAPA
jgi:anti-sigma B factor antagonist